MKTETLRKLLVSFAMLLLFLCAPVEKTALLYTTLGIHAEEKREKPAHPDNITSQVELKKYVFTKILMGGEWTITVYSAEKKLAEDVTKKAFDRVKQINDIFSNYKDTSEVTLLAKTYKPGKPAHVSRELFNLTFLSHQFSQQTDGVFDITVGPLVEEWQRARRRKKLPDEKRILEIQKATGYTRLKLNRCQSTMTFTAPDMSLDFGAIGKGYAVDEAYKIFEASQLKTVLINGNGNLYAGTPPPDKKSWVIAIELPDTSHQKPASKSKNVYVNLADQGIATSGDLYQYYEHNGIRYSHIVDPRTCTPLTRRTSVTVVAKDALTADVAATALCVSGKPGVRTWQKLSPCLQFTGVDINKDEISTWQSPGWEKLRVK